jgi:TRAP-type C4-dicarboxylate transport system permease small subunit
MGASVINVLWQVLTRFVLGSPSSYTEELARYLLIWIGLLGAAFAGGRHLHLAIDLLPTRFVGRRHTIVVVVINFCIGAFAVGVLVIGGIRLVALTLSLGQTSAALGIPIGYVYLALPLSGLMMTWYVVRDLHDHLRGG